MLIEDIVSGRLPTGAMLPREVDIAKQFDVSRGVARETIRALEERGLIAVKHGRGATVVDEDDWNILDAEVLQALLDSDQGSSILGQYLECRRILEVEAAGLAAQKATKKHVDGMDSALAAMEAATSRASDRDAEQLFHEADVEFHQALMRATGNRALGALAERIHTALLVARFPLARPEYRQERALPEHRRILEAVRDGDADAAGRAMSDHLDTIASYLREEQRSSRRRRSPAAA